MNDYKKNIIKKINIRQYLLCLIHSWKSNWLQGGSIPLWRTTRGVSVMVAKACTNGCGPFRNSSILLLPSNNIRMWPEMDYRCRSGGGKMWVRVPSSWQFFRPIDICVDIHYICILNNILNLDTKSMVELSLAVTSFGVKKIEEIKKTKKDM